MGPDILLIMLGIPVSWLTNLGYEKIKAFSEKIEMSPLQGLFIRAFYKSLNRYGKDYKEGIKKLKNSIKQKETEFLEIFNANLKDYNSLITALQKDSFHKNVAMEIVNRFEVEENFKGVMVIIVRDCLKSYQGVFLKTMNEKQGIQLNLLLQGVTIDMIQELIKGEEKDKKAKKPKKKGKQIKILSMMASPKGESYILYEQEQDTLLEAFKYFDREEVFLDMPDPVKSTLDEIQEHLENGHHDILHITAHGGINKEGEGVLSLEDERGELQEVTGAELVKVLKPSPRIVILSACHSAREEQNLMPVAKALFKTGIETVIGMKKAVSHMAAIEFTVGFFKTLCQKKTIIAAFEQGKQKIFKGEQQRIEKIPNWESLEEYEIPQLLTQDESLTVEKFSDHRIEAPGRPESHHFMGAKYLERGFIGRRQILRDIYKTIEEGEGVVVLKGPGGIGKSTLTTRAAANLRRKGYDFIVVQGETTIEQILEAISKKAAAQGVERAREIYEANAEVNEKLGWYLDHFLLRQKMVIIFDNFEENQDEEKGDFHRERLKKFLWYFRECLKHKDTFLFFSTRYTLPGFDSPEITKEIHEFSDVESRKMLLNSKALKRLDNKSIKILQQEIGGNPRALELLDLIAHKKFKQREYTWDQLIALFPKLQERIILKKGIGDDFTPLFLDKLLSYLTESQRLLLDILAIYRNPVPEAAIIVHNVSMEGDDHIKLGDLSLLESIDVDEIGGDLYYVHRLTAQYLLGKISTSVKNKYHLQAAQYFEAIQTEEGYKYLENDIEARWHYIQAGQWDKAAGLTFDLDKYLSLHGYPQWSMELLQELYISKLSEENQVIAYGKLGNLVFRFGEYDSAISTYFKSLDIAKRINHNQHVAGALHQIGWVYQEKGQYDEALKMYKKSLKIRNEIKDTKGISDCLHHIGMIHEYKGNYEKALKQYENSLEIDERIGDTAGIAISLHQIGRIYEEKGSYEKALKQYEKSLEIAERIGDTAGIASSLHQIGMIYEKKGSYDEALKIYGKSRMTFKEIGDIANEARSLHQIGRIYEEKGSYEKALKQYEKSLEIKQRIGDTAGIASSLHQIGMIYEYKGSYEKALKQYEKSLEITERIGNISGMAITMGQMGQLYFKQNEFETALKLSIQAFLIYKKLESPNVDLAKEDIARVREKMPEEQFNGILKEFNLKPEIFDAMEAEDQQK